MKSKNLILIICLTVFTGCKKDLTADDLISPLTLSATQVLADGTSMITVTSKMNTKTDADKRSVTFTASMGSFLGGTDSTITQKAVFIDKELVATVRFIAPSSEGIIKITARALPQDVYHDYSQTAIITAVPSTPARLSLTASGFAVKIAFGSELTITGKVTNNTGTPVSRGSKVTFEDRYTDGTIVGGSFRALQTASDGSGTVSAIYSPGNVPAGRQIIVTCYLLGPAGEKTAIKDAVTINTIPN